jgi:hypothetical protein
MFIINKNGHYFEINENINVDTNTFHNCTFFETEEAMLEAVCKQQNLEIDEVEGSTLSVVQREDGTYVMNDRCDMEEVDTTVEAFISEYEL